MGLIRFLLATSVVIAHTGGVLFGMHLVGGRIAVQTFYVISGFYMSLVLNEKYYNKKNSYFLFLSSRFLRLFPLYWAVLLLVILYTFIVRVAGVPDFSAVQSYVQYIASIKLSSLVFLFVTNLFIFFQDWVMFMGVSLDTGKLFFSNLPLSITPSTSQFLLVPQAWSIGVELTFYLLAPLLVKRSLRWILLCMALSVSLRAGLMIVGLTADPWTYRFFPTELVFFLLGTVSYLIYKKIRLMQLKAIYFKIAFGLVLALLVLFEFIHFTLFGYIFILIFSVLLPFIFLYSKNWKLDSYIGDLSYPIYICHIFVLSMYQSAGFGISNTTSLLVLASTIVLSVVLNETISKRIEKIRQKRIVNSADLASQRS